MQNVTKTESLQIGESQAALCLGNMQQSIGTTVAITVGIRQGADADAVKDDENNALNRHGLRMHEFCPKKSERKDREG
jgi:hypothetical protein